MQDKIAVKSRLSLYLDFPCFADFFVINLNCPRTWTLELLQLNDDELAHFMDSLTKPSNMHH